MDFLEMKGGRFDFGQFTGRFIGVKKRQLEPHFAFVSVGGAVSGRWEIRLSDAAEPAGERRPPPPPPPPPKPKRGGAPREDHSSRRLAGRVLFYDRVKGFGFVNSDEEPGDFFFPRAALPRDLQEATPEEMRGFEVFFDLTFKEGKPRAGSLEPAGGGHHRRAGASTQPLKRRQGNVGRAR